MAMAQDRLPPLLALRVFESAARHLSFTKAAEELFVTPGAVSQQIRLLEEHLGVEVFVRNGRRVALSDAGRAGVGAIARRV
jgi:LysR family transcriptional regulator, glycine cleavage system transcriptional activator